MAEALSGGNVAVALLANTIATGAILFVMITMLAPVSGAHFNPAVSGVMAARGALSWREAGLYVAAQLAGGLIAVAAVHLMFDLPILQASTKARAGIGQWTGELVATFGLILTIIGTARHRSEWVAPVGRALHRRGLLVHQLHQLRQPGDHHRAQPERQLRRNRAGGCAGVCGGAAGRGGAWARWLGGGCSTSAQ